MASILIVLGLLLVAVAIVAWGTREVIVEVWRNRHRLTAQAAAIAPPLHARPDAPAQIALEAGDKPISPVRDRPVADPFAHAPLPSELEHRP